MMSEDYNIESEQDTNSECFQVYACDYIWVKILLYFTADVFIFT